MDTEKRKEINRILSEFTDANCLNCYARLEDDGRLHLDDKFKIVDLIEILKIVGAITT